MMDQLPLAEIAMQFLKHDQPLIPWHLHPAHWLVLSVEYGADRQQLLLDSDLNPADLERADFLINWNQYLALVRSALKQTGRADMGLEIGKRLMINSHGMVGLALMSASSVSQGLDLLVKVKNTVTPIFELRRVDYQKITLIQALPSIDNPPEIISFVECLFASIYQCFVQITGRLDISVEVDFAHDQPEWKDSYQFFNAQVKFNQGINQIKISSELLEVPVHLANPVALASSLPMFESLLEPFRQRQGLLMLIRNQIRQQLPDVASQQQIAESLNISISQLKRSLTSCHSSYQQQLDLCRQDLARQMLEFSSLAVDEIARELGFAEAASFRRAFKRWCGLSPSQYRLLATYSQEVINEPETV